MSTNKQALREAAEKANELNPAIGLKEFARRTVDYHALANPAVVLALLDELEAAERRNAELEARPANPINFKENADADYCRGWAWNEVKKELGTDTWTVGDNCTYYGFFCWGWDSRRQYNEQRADATDKGE
ncbi:ead/Ea22-like family protein [Enterobacter kobei]|uniref:ead/Ea22-like family protein n=1 Tax=Enterobacter kobei TaxID=208224 RepID=UPI001EE28AC8|nr:ead/Ea22-like family protein [Enterobacter kobei]